MRPLTECSALLWMPAPPPPSPPPQILPECRGSVSCQLNALPGFPSVPVALCSICPFFLSLFECWDDGTSGAATRQRHMVSAPLGSVRRQDLALPGHAWLPVTWQRRHKTKRCHRCSREEETVFFSSHRASHHQFRLAYFSPLGPSLATDPSLIWFKVVTGVQDQFGPYVKWAQSGGLWREREGLLFRCRCCWAGDALVQGYLYPSAWNLSHLLALLSNPLTDAPLKKTLSIAFLNWTKPQRFGLCDSRVETHSLVLVAKRSELFTRCTD